MVKKKLTVVGPARSRVEIGVWLRKSLPAGAKNNVWCGGWDMKHCLKTGMENDERNSTNVETSRATTIHSPGPSIFSVSGSKRWIETK